MTNYLADLTKMKWHHPPTLEHHIIEEHAQEIIKLLEPCLVGYWCIKHTDEFGTFRIINTDCITAFQIETSFCEDTKEHSMMIIVREMRGFRLHDSFKKIGKYTGWSGGAVRLDHFPLEVPNLIELLFGFVFERLRMHTELLIVSANH